MGQHIVTALIILASVSATVIGNLALKVGAERPSVIAIGPLNWHVASAVAAFAVAFMFYGMLLRRLPLSLAQAILSVQFILVIFAAHLVLHESIGVVRWIGISLMALGLMVVGISADARSTPPVAHFEK